MKRLILFLAFLTSFSVYAKKPFYPIPNDSLLMMAGTDSLLLSISGDSAKFVTDKDFFGFNKTVTVNGDTLTGKIVISAIVADSMNVLRDSLGSKIDTLTNQNIYGVKSFIDTLKANDIKTLDSKPFYSYSAGSLSLINPINGFSLISANATDTYFSNSLGSSVLHTAPTYYELSGFGGSAFYYSAATGNSILFLNQDSAIFLGNDSRIRLKDTVMVKGSVLPETTLTYDLGSSSYKWNDLYLSGSTIYLGNDSITESNYYSKDSILARINDSLNLAVRLTGDQTIGLGVKTFTDDIAVGGRLKVDTIWTAGSLVTVNDSLKVTKSLEVVDTLTALQIKSYQIQLDGYSVLESQGGGYYKLKGFQGADFVSINDNATEIAGGNSGVTWLSWGLGTTSMANPNTQPIFVADTAFTSIRDPQGGSDIIMVTDTTVIINNPIGGNYYITMSADTLRLGKVAKSDSVIYSLGIYGEIIADSVVTAQTIVDSTWTKITAFNLVGENSLVTCVADSIVIQKTGMYVVKFNFATCSDVKDITTTMVLYKNGVKTKLVDCAWVNKDLGTFSLNGSRMLSLTAGDVLDCRLYHTDVNSADITLRYGSLSVLYISNE